MASRSVSPGGALLRASRIFSIPPALPVPKPDLTSAAIYNSDTATTIYPTHLAITTPQSSLARGDWGFKRALPRRLFVKTSTPMIKVKAIDTMEQVTEFGSAADHSLTLAKWLEMDTPLTIPVSIKAKRTYLGVDGPQKSVFDTDIDRIAHGDYSQQAKSAGDSRDLRWKFSGPWLAGMAEGEFQEYLASEVRKRKGDFDKFLRKECAAALTSAAREQARDAPEEPVAPIQPEAVALDGQVKDSIEPHVDPIEPEAIALKEQAEDSNPTPFAPIRPEDLTSDQLRAFTKELRTERRKELYRIVRDFLDLPPAPSATLSVADDLVGKIGAQEDMTQPSVTDHLETSSSPYAQHGPPKTHPSAGLSYSRSSRHIVNHPEFGPQKEKTPLPARVVMPKNSSTGKYPAVLGVGGVVVNVPKGQSDFDTGRFKSMVVATIGGLDTIELNKTGGSKTFVAPVTAKIDSRGKINLIVKGADPDAVAIAEGKAHEIPHREAQAQVYKRPTLSRSIGYSNMANQSGAAGWGLKRND